MTTRGGSGCLILLGEIMVRRCLLVLEAFAVFAFNFHSRIFLHKIFLLEH